MLRLIIPEQKYHKSYLEAIRESEGHFTYATGIFYNPEGRDLFEMIENQRRGINLLDGYVPSTYLWLVDDKEFIGMINIRHSLTDFLRYYGGHIGYAIRYSKWGRGYGTRMLFLALKYCLNTLNINKVLVTCNNENVASKRVIEKNGGVLSEIADVVVSNESFKIRKYWISIDQSTFKENGEVIN